MKPRILILPGRFSSGPDHWQTRWELEHPSFRRVSQRDWQTPDRAEWVATLQSAITESTAPAMLVAHSLACSLVAHWAGAHRGPVSGALLVAPSDVDAVDFPAGTTGFAPMPLLRLPFPSIAVTSTDDPYNSVARAAHYASAWGSRLEIVGPLGHINSGSGLGSWPQGFAFLQHLMTGAGA